MKYAIVGVLLTVAACGPTPGAPAKIWTAREFVASTTKKVTFGGLPPARLGVLSGEPIPWRSKPFAADDVLQGAGRGLPLWPAFAEGKTATVLFTEIWDNHPTPWIQVVYAPVTGGVRRAELPTVFSVGVDSTFYSPYWRAQLTEVPASTASDEVTSATKVINSKYPQTKGPLVVCPIVPSDVGVARADGEVSLARPLSGEPVPAVGLNQAWVDGVAVSYLGITTGIEPSAENALLPVEAPVYFFVKAGRVLSLPPVLPDAPQRHSFLRRYEVALQPTFGVFVPGDRTELIALLASEGVEVPAADATIPEAVAAPYLLRVATNPSCFLDAANFPTSCAWLDSQPKVEAAFGGDVRGRTEALFTASTLQVGP